MTAAGFFDVAEGPGPLVATAIHDGHEVREDLRERFALNEATRLREEDPFTGEWTAVAGTRVVVRRSRFEVDLNRPRERAVYREPADAWGLDIWKAPLPDEVVEASLAEYDAFYARLERLLKEVTARAGGFVVFDLHSYNHRRGGAGAEVDDPEANPEINIGTGSLDRGRWGPLADRLMSDLRDFDFLGRRLDVRENVKFSGGNMTRHIHRELPEAGCCIAIEAKKIFMNEWTGEKDAPTHSAVGAALLASVPDVLEELQKVI